jgi:hypothetical protein
MNQTNINQGQSTWCLIEMRFNKLNLIGNVAVHSPIEFHAITHIFNCRGPIMWIRNKIVQFFISKFTVNRYESRTIVWFDWKHHRIHAKQIKTSGSRFRGAVRITVTRCAFCGLSSPRVGKSMRCPTLPDEILSDRMETAVLNLSNRNQNCAWPPWRDHSSSWFDLVIPLKSEPSPNRILIPRGVCLPFRLSWARLNVGRKTDFDYFCISRSASMPGQSRSCDIQQVANWTCFDHHLVRQSQQPTIER